MKQRTNAYETIRYRGNELISVPICVSSKRVVKLMEEDYIELDFSLAQAICFPVGAYCDDEIFGRFYVTEEQLPKYNATTGGYEYELKLEAWYRCWKQKFFMMTETTTASSKVYMRKEVTWTLTDSLLNQLRELCINLQMLGYIPASYNLRNGDSDLLRFIDIQSANVPKAKAAQVMSYDTTTILDALKSLADTWECEWWITGTEEAFVIHFGKCETGKYIPLRIGENVESMDVSRDESTYGNKIYAFGGTVNIPPGYRKELRAVVKDKATVMHNGNAVTMYCLDTSRKFTNDMFASTGTSNILTGIINEETSQEFPNQMNIPAVQTKNLLEVQRNYVVEDIPKGGDTSHSADEFLLYENDTTMSAKEGTLAVSFNSGSAMVQGVDAKDSLSLHVFLDVIMQYRDVVTDETTGERTEAWYEAAVYCNNEYEEPLADDAYQTNSSSQYWHVKLQGKTYSYEFTPSNIMPDHFGTGNMRMIARVRVALKSSGAVTIPQGTWAADVDLYNQMTLQTSGENTGIGISWENGTQRAARIMFAPCNVSPATYIQGTTELHPLAQYYYWFARFGKSDGSQPLADIPNLETGDEITIDSSAAFGVPSAYYVDSLDDPSSLRKIGESRLRLPNKRIVHGDWVLTKYGYIVHKDYEDAPEAQDVQEIYIAFDGVYPDGKLQVTWVGPEYKTEKVTYEGEAQKSSWTYRAYHLHLKTLNGKEFTFNKKFRLENEKLELRFLTPEDTLGSENEMSGADYPNNFKLAGMKFEVAFNDKISYSMMSGTPTIVSEQDYTLVRNEDYGTKLPNDLLCPTVNDPCVLEGWNVKAMSHLGLIDEAENYLAEMAFAYVEALSQGSFSFDCSMMSTFYGNDVEDSYDILGQRVSIYNDALTEDVSHARRKLTRVLGYELKLDIPYDSPTLTCGETEAYSRIKQLEKGVRKLNSKTVKNNYYYGGGLTVDDFGDGYTMEIDTGGDSLIAYGETKTLTCRIYNALRKDVTNSVLAWQVVRESGDKASDTAWLLKDKVKAFNGTINIVYSEEENDLGTATSAKFIFTATIGEDEVQAILEI